jgi:hypothetical protein
LYVIFFCGDLVIGDLKTFLHIVHDEGSQI